MASMDLLRLGEADNWWRPTVQSCCNEDTMAAIAQSCRYGLGIVRTSRYIKGRSLGILITACASIHKPRRQDEQQRRTCRAAMVKQAICTCDPTQPDGVELLPQGSSHDCVTKHVTRAMAICALCGCVLKLTCTRCNQFQLRFDQIEVRDHSVVILLKLITTCNDCWQDKCECQAPVTSCLVATCGVPGCTRKICASCVGQGDTSSEEQRRGCTSKSAKPPHPGRGRRGCTPPSRCAAHRQLEPSTDDYTVGWHITCNAGRYAHRGNWSVSFTNRLPEHLHSEDAVRLAAIESMRKIIITSSDRETTR